MNAVVPSRDPHGGPGVTGPPAVEIDGLSVRLDGHAVVRGVSLTVETGEWVTVIGPNGAGKSTLLRAIGGVLPYAGTLALFGRPAHTLPRRERARLLATVPQTPAVPPGMTVVTTCCSAGPPTSHHWPGSRPPTWPPWTRC
jgi:iron complex transport system ATP-binding protein